MTASSTKQATGFAGSVAILAAGQLLAMVVPLVAAPILGRLYVPSEYGVFALYVACVGILGVFATLQLHHAIIATGSRRAAVHLVQLCSITSITISCVGALLYLITIFFLDFFSNFSMPSDWLLFLPLSVLLLGLSGSVGSLANRLGRYKEIAGIQVLVALITVSVAIFGGKSGWGFAGLLAGHVAGQSAGAVGYLLLYRHLSKGVRMASGARLRALFLRYKKFPIFTLPSELLGIAGQQLPVFALSVLGATALTGSFGRAFQLVVAPITLVGVAVGQVFRQKASEDYRQHGTCAPIFRRTAVTLLAFGLPCCIVILAFAPEMFAFYLGPNWYQAGEVARILAPMILLRLVSSPLSVVFLFADAQHNDAAVMLGAFGICVSFVTAGVIIYDDPMVIIIGFSFAYSLIYIVQLAWSYRLALGKGV